MRLRVIVNGRSKIVNMIKNTPESNSYLDYFVILKRNDKIPDIDCQVINNDGKVIHTEHLHFSFLNEAENAESVVYGITICGNRVVSELHYSRSGRDLPQCSDGNHSRYAFEYVYDEFGHIKYDRYGPITKKYKTQSSSGIKNISEDSLPSFCRGVFKYKPI